MEEPSSKSDSEAEKPAGASANTLANAKSAEVQTVWEFDVPESNTSGGKTGSKRSGKRRNGTGTAAGNKGIPDAHSTSETDRSAAAPGGTGERDSAGKTAPQQTAPSRKETTTTQGAPDVVAEQPESKPATTSSPSGAAGGPIESRDKEPQANVDDDTNSKNENPGLAGAETIPTVAQATAESKAPKASDMKTPDSPDPEGIKKNSSEGVKAPEGPTLGARDADQQSHATSTESGNGAGDGNLDVDSLVTRLIDQLQLRKRNPKHHERRRPDHKAKKGKSDKEVVRQERWRRRKRLSGATRRLDFSATSLTGRVIIQIAQRLKLTNTAAIEWVFDDLLKRFGGASSTDQSGGKRNVG